VSEVADEYAFRRGLLEHVALHAEAFADSGEALLRAAPIVSVTVEVGGWQDVKAVARCRHLLRVRELTLVGEGMGSAGAKILAESPNAANLTKLCLAHHSLGRPGVQALACSRYLANLRELDLRATNLGRDAFTHLANSSTFARLARLDLRENWVTDVALRAIASSPHPSRLSDLRVDAAQLTGEGPESIAGSPLVARLSSLTIANLTGELTVLRALAHLDWRELRELAVEKSRLGPDACAVLAGARSLAGLTRLSLRGNPVGGYGLRALADSPYLTQLAWLDLAGSGGLADGELRRLADQDVLPRLHVLDLTGRKVSDETVALLSRRMAVLR
jgi:hypothetical protein